MGLFNSFKSSPEESTRTQQPTWDPDTIAMQQPSSPPAPTIERVVIEQPQNKQRQLRGGGEGADCCCGLYVRWSSLL
ncbi:hypothetical protein BDV29DRAFT_154104 [Aspergillus leporis]|uniref:Uncharacterized protein n=1 Tax=Aspergillus leporis TaxID=41062 RepID=A0A5N5X8C7_9EURO|nr:hypothetical protein BDV29DRAFT_154104 [Aspergillus leporis]